MNNTIFFFFYNLAHQSKIIDSIIIFFAVYFPFIVVILASIFLIIYRNSWKEFFLVFFSSFLAYSVSEIFKFLFHTPRPFLVFSEVQPLFSQFGYAFTSGHTAFFTALFFAIFFLHKKASYVFLFFALLIGLARIMAGVHFPVDIFGGFVLGGIVSYIIICIFNKKCIE